MAGGSGADSRGGLGAPVTGGGGSGPGPAACSLQVERGRLWPWARRGGAGHRSRRWELLQPLRAACAGREGAAADLPFAYLGLAAGLRKSEDGGRQEN